VKKTLEQLIQETKTIGLEKDEKAHIREVVFSYVKEHPVKGEEIASPHTIRQPLSLPFRRAFALAALSIFIIGGGVSYAAEGSLPGDLLYPVKVRGTEPVRTLLAFSNEAKAELQIQFVERRLAETEKLVSLGRLRPVVSRDTQFAFEAHVDRASEYISAIAAHGDLESAVDTSSNLESSLAAHQKILEVLAEQKVAEKFARVATQEILDTESIIARVEDRNNRIIDARRLIEEKFSQELHDQGRINGAFERRIEDLKEKLAKARQDIEETSFAVELTEATQSEQLQEVESIIEEIREKIEEGEAGEAFSLFQSVHRSLREIEVITEARRRLQIHIPFYDLSDAGNDSSDIDEEDGKNGEHDRVEGEVVGGSSE